MANDDTKKKDKDGTKPEIDTISYYKIIGVDKSATDDEIKKAYKKKARELHPDRHQNDKDLYQSKFQELNKAFDTLKDPNKRKLYDKYGEEGVKRGHEPYAGGMQGIFEQLFKTKQHDTGTKKSPPIKRYMDVTLSDVYIGVTKTIKITKYISDGDDNKVCEQCKGKGIILLIQRMGHMILQQRAECDVCKGKGYILSEKEVDIDVHIPIGGVTGDSVTINGVGHEYPDHEIGDLIVILRQLKHDDYSRKGADLGMTHVLSLREALCGFKIRILHPSGKNLVIQSGKINDVVQPGSLWRVLSMGMPQRYSPHIKGHLYIIMDVKIEINDLINDQFMIDIKNALPDYNIDNTACDEYMNEPINIKNPNNETTNDDDDTKDNIETTNNSNDDNNVSPNSDETTNDNKTNDDDNKNTNDNSSTNNDNNPTKPKTIDNNDDIKEPTNNNDNITDEIEIVDVETVNVDDNPKPTPYASANVRDEEYGGQRVQCQHM